ncbi:organic cation/carnitine transporter 7-like [Tripterygium wilfordii]|nr:organic cation/carnitine transporter 7-like [Tripterygium wilfordii]XP_038711279.1 organic cation/carnitine transporter 7-like [Tripterygium wilfordii]XP_038711280.1 organic cation/carnitine transporter 7-like [Tripterygium wilfordii]
MEDHSLVYTLDEKLGAVRFGTFQCLVLVYAGLGWFAEAMEIMILSFVGPVVKSEWGLSLNEESLITTVVFAGVMIGSYSWGLLSDNYGRRKGFLFASLITSVAGLLSAFSPSYRTLVALRFLVGIGLGGGSVFLSWFLEFVPAHNRGMWTVVFTTFWTFGTIFEASLAWIVMPRLNWRWLLALSSVPSFALLLFYGFVPESPRYLCMKGQIADANQILETIAVVNKVELPPGKLVFYGNVIEDEESVPLEGSPLLSSTRKRIMKCNSFFSSFFMLFSRKLIWTTLLLWILFFGSTFTYYGIILLTSELSIEQSKCRSIILHEGKSQDNSIYIDAFITSLAELPGLLLSAVLVDRVGRKISMAIMFVLAFVFLLPLLLHQSSVVTTGLLFGARMCAIGSFTVACIYAPEIYPTSVRATGAGVASSFGRIGGMVCPLVAISLISGCEEMTAIIVFEIVIAITVVCIFFFPFDTMGKELIDDVDISNSSN